MRHRIECTSTPLPIPMHPCQPAVCPGGGGGWKLDLVAHGPVLKKKASMKTMKGGHERGLMLPTVAHRPEW